MNEIIEKIKENQIVCTVQVDNLENLLRKVEYLQENGLTLIEITYRTDLTLERN